MAAELRSRSALYRNTAGKSREKQGPARGNLRSGKGWDIAADTMNNAFLKLHLSVVLAGFTGVFGKLITLNEGLLVWYRLLLTSLMLFVFLRFSGGPEKSAPRHALAAGATGLLLALHWVCFYGSIKASNVFEPLLCRRRVSAREMLFSLITIAGVGLIFHFDVRYRLGIAVGVLGAALAALFTVCNKHVSAGRDTLTTLLYEMLGGAAGIGALLPVYLALAGHELVPPPLADMIMLLLLSLFCTVFLYVLQIQVLRDISAFTVNLTYNLEPVYSIAMAMLFLGEARELNASFYGGLGLIILSVALQTWSSLRSGGASPPS